MTSELQACRPWPEKMCDPDARRVFVGAHADDESLFVSGLVIRHPGRWTVICCSIPYNEPIRAWKFFDACDAMGAVGRLLPWTEKRNAPLQNLNALDTVLDRADVIVTHGALGEYGHAGHISVHKHIAKKWGDKSLFIGYGQEDKATVHIELTDEEWRKKLAVIGSYDQYMRWSGRMMPVHEALLFQYHKPFGKFDLRRECFYTLPGTD